ncbi:MAG TPA: TrkA family potassium uptake protein [Anaerovoracaceae bacterium]|nr:TrkA family potassium uptake protein [Anaerovoracaceae bacterium]
MQIIVAGCGKVGSQFAKMMSEEGHDIVVVDSNIDNFKMLGPNFKGLTVLGVPIDEDVLKEAGIESAEGLAAVTPDDNINMMACQVAKEVFNVSRIFCRIQDPVREQVFYQFGVHTICPTDMAVQEFRALMLGETSSTSCFINNTGIDFDYSRVKGEDVGKYVSDLKVAKNTIILGLLKEGQLQFNNPKLKIGFDDEIVTIKKL